MAKVTRRAFLSTTAGAAAGVAAISLSGPRMVAEAARDAAEGSGSVAAGEPVMAFVRDASKGEVSVMVGHREVTTHDPQLVKRLIRASR